MSLTSIAFCFQLRLWLVAMYLAVSALGMAFCQETVNTAISRDTDERVKDAGWWPTKGTLSINEYAGSTACAGCHKGIAELQKQTPMSKAASRFAEASTPEGHGELHFIDGKLSYAMKRNGPDTEISVTRNSESLTVPVPWAMGHGEIGITYLLEHKDTYIESRLSYFPSLHGLDITPGQSATPPSTLEESLGEPLDSVAAVRCFGCHTTASSVSGKFDPERSIPGVQCEACHGPGAEHIRAVKEGDDSAASPLNPKTLSPVDSVDFCGACHRTPADVAVHMSPDLGLISIRFQPYRLERSLCWGSSGDPRITCIACHDPHKPLVKDTASYDSKCLQCHAAPGHTAGAGQAHACTVANKDCASCHMPRYELKPAHAIFTDHFIQIVRPNSGFRN